jgi:hypothetical protein
MRPLRNPLRSEAESFRFLLAVIVAALVIVGAAYLNTWLGVAAALLAVAGLVWWLMQEPVPGAAEPPRKVDPSTPAGQHKVLVVALPGTASVTVPERATEVVVVVPALASKLEAATGAVDDRRADAEQTALALTRRLSRPGVGVRGEVGADDPVLAAEDTMRLFGADEILVAAGDDVVEQIRGRVTVPVSRV